MGLRDNVRVNRAQTVPESQQEKKGEPWEAGRRYLKRLD